MTALVRAPGKAMLVGEYAVLDGAQAVVAAVDCYAEARLCSDGPAPTPFVEAALATARAELLRRGRSLPPGVPIVDTTAFYRGGKKLGVGSSAAVTVAALGVLFSAAGVELDRLEHRRTLFTLARRAHDAAQGVSGSGADILAATWGGLRTLNDPASSPDEAVSLTLPAPLELRFVATSRSASTAELVARYRAVGAVVEPARQRMAEAARRFVAACHSGDAAVVLSAIVQAQAAYQLLGEAMGRELVTAEHRAIAAVAQRVGGVAKPSGAGGGDLAVVFLPDAAAAAAFYRELTPAGTPEGLPDVTPLPLRISPHGVQAII